jgi:hypothetical protein
MILVVWNGKDHYQRVPSEWSHLPGPHPGKRKAPPCSSQRQARTIIHDQNTEVQCIGQR